MSSARERAVIPSGVESEKGNYMQTHNPPNIEVLYRQDTRRAFGSHIQSLLLPERY